MKKIEFTKEMYDNIKVASDSVAGTANYTKYYMETYCKSNTSWHFIGWGIPYSNHGEIKFTTFGTFIYTDDGERYRVTDEVYDLLHLEDIM